MKGFILFLIASCCVILSLQAILTEAQCPTTKYLNAQPMKAQIISSPGYPAKYPNDITCKWILIVPYYGFKIQLDFIDFNTYGSPGYCDSSYHDVLEVYDSMLENSNKTLGKYCGSTLPATVVSQSTSMLITFTASKLGWLISKGNRFRMEYKAVYSLRDSLCSPSNTAYANDNIRLTSSSATKYIKSPWYPYQYPRNIQCTWYIRASSSSKRIELTLSDVNIYNRYSYCSRYSSDKDMLLITDGSSIYGDLLKLVCNSLSSSTVHSTVGSMTVQFKTNSVDYFFGNYSGFKLQYREYKDDSNVGMIVGIVFGVIAALGLLICCICICKRKGASGNVQRVPATSVLQPAPMTTSTGQSLNPPTSRYPMQTQGGPPAPGSYPFPAYPPQGQLSHPTNNSSFPLPQGSFPPPKGGFPPPQGSFPLPQGSFPPPQGQSYPPPVQSTYPVGGYVPTVNDPIPSEPPPQYPGLNPGASQAMPPYNPQFQGSSQTNPPYPTSS